MTYQLANAKVWDGGDWVDAVGIPPWPVNVDATPANVIVTADASVHTKGAWTQLIASTAAAADLLFIYCINSTTNVATEGLLDIGIGAAGAETVMVANAIGGQLSNALRNDQIFPVSIPAGSRVAARLQNVIGSRSANMRIGLLSSGVKAPAALDTIGADTAASRGTNMPSANTYVELTASTSQAYRAIVMAPIGATNVGQNHTSTFTLAKGASGSEVELGRAVVRHLVQEICCYDVQQVPFVYYGNVPAGTRLAVKQSVASSVRDVILYGVPYA
jgi:hypothetical protein